MKVYAKPELRASRIKKGYSIAGLSNEIGMTKQNLGQVECRVNGISPEKSKLLTDFLGVEFDEVFELVERA